MRLSGRRWTRLAALVLGIFLPACAASAAKDPGKVTETSSIPPAEFMFDRYEVVTGSAKGQTVLTGYLLGGAVADLAVVSIDDHDDLRLRIYALGDGTWDPRIDAPLRREVSFVDVANIGGRERLITYGDGRLTWFDPESATERELVAATSDFNPPPRGEIPHVDVTRDVNADGRDDLVVPELPGFWVFIQMEDGAFADPVKIGTSTGMGWIYGAGGYRHSPWLQGGVHEMDYDRDGRSDLVFWKQGRFQVHHQDERGRFGPQVKTFTADVALDGGQNTCCRLPENGFDSFEACYEADHSSLTTGDMKEKMLHSLTDVNGDGVADLVVYSLEGRSVFSVHSTYEVYFGTPTPDGGTVFAADVGTSIPSDGLQVVMQEHDYDGDGQADMMFTSVNIGFFKVVGALVTRSMSMDLEFYRMDNGIYPDKPNATGKIKLGLSRQVAGKKAVAYAPVLIGDVNGDRRSDLLVQKNRKTLHVFLGVPGPDLFARRPQKVAVAMPRGQEYTWLVNLNKDDKQDILMHHLATNEPHRVTMLIAR